MPHVRPGLVAMVILCALAACEREGVRPAPGLPPLVPPQATTSSAQPTVGPAPSRQSPRPTPATPATGQPDVCRVKSLTRTGQGWYPDWSKTNDLIVFDKGVGPLSILEVFTMKPDGSEEKCLTCGKDIPGTFRRTVLGQIIGGHRGEPSWHPSGDYIVFLALNEHGDLIKGISGLGANNDVFIMTADGEKYWQITNMLPHRGIGGPGFSHDGKQIEWIEEYSCERQTCPQPWLEEEQYRCCAPLDERSLERNQGEDFLLLQIKMADISFGSGGPVLGDVRTVNVNQGGKRLLDHGSGFTPDDDHLIFKAADMNETNGRPFCADVYTSDLAGDASSFRRLTHTPDAHEENTTYSPNGHKIAYTSGPLVGYVFFKLDLYLMDADGENQTRLTYFNEPGHPEFDNQLSSVGQGTWSPDGIRYLFHVFEHHSKTVSFSDWSGNFCSGTAIDEYWKRIAWQKAHLADIYLNIRATLYMLTFEGPCGQM